MGSGLLVEVVEDLLAVVLKYATTVTSTSCSPGVEKLYKKLACNTKKKSYIKWATVSK